MAERFPPPLPANQNDNVTMPETTPTPGDIERAEQLKNEGNDPDLFSMSHSSNDVAGEQKPDANTAAPD